MFGENAFEINAVSPPPPYPPLSSPPLPLPVPPSLGLVRNVENPFAKDSKDSKNGLFPYISRNPLFSFIHICVLILKKAGGEAIENKHLGLFIFNKLDMWEVCFKG